METDNSQGTFFFKLVSSTVCRLIKLVKIFIRLIILHVCVYTFKSLENCILKYKTVVLSGQIQDSLNISKKNAEELKELMFKSMSS